jgi:hypothetical protein
MAGLPYLEAYQVDRDMLKRHTTCTSYWVNTAMAFKVDVTQDAEIRAMVAGCAYGRHQPPPREFKKSRAEVEAERDAQVPSRKKMGTGWDVANAALFLASDEGQLHHRRDAARGRRRECGGARSRGQYSRQLQKQRFADRKLERRALQTANFRRSLVMER